MRVWSLFCPALLSIHALGGGVLGDRVRTWEATVGPDYELSAAERLRWQRKLGVIDPQARTRQAIARGDVRQLPDVDLSGVDIPTSFDSATHWPHCAKVIDDISDQGNCGCCWAFGGATAASDRACIASNGTIAEPLSAGAICFSVYNGCGGGDMHTPWLKIQSGHVVSGGQHNNSINDPFHNAGLCYDYPLPHCTHHVGTNSSCPYPKEGTAGCPDLPSGQSPTAPSKCDASARPPHDEWSSDVVSFRGDIVVHPNTPAAVQHAIMTGGPVAVSMQVYSDFPTYKSGVYRTTTGDVLGDHAVRIVGWGVDNGVPYWRVANSWNRFWGEQGYFRIVRGSDEAGILNTVFSSADDAVWSRGGK